MAIFDLPSAIAVMPAPVPPPVTETIYSFCRELNASAAASPRGKTVVDPDTVTGSDALIVAIDPINRAINNKAASLLIFSPEHRKFVRYVKLSKILNIGLYTLLDVVECVESQLPT
jgi:hypothetical protein